MSINSKDIINGLSPDDLTDLEEKVTSKLAVLNKASRIIKDEVFKILANSSTLIQYPIEDDELCAFVCIKRGTIFSFINSFIPYEKQIFAAAHELYHIWYDEDVLARGEILSNATMELQNTNIDGRELKANRFAAMLLVPEDVLLNELKYMRIKQDEIQRLDIVKLMDVFCVPYRTMVRRLREINFISAEAYNSFYAAPDKHVLLLQKRLQVGDSLYSRPKNIKFGSLVDDTLSAYEKKLISERKLRSLLSIAQKQPEDFGISTPQPPSEEELLEIVGDIDEDE
jgi:Zn-dependent peptidase ImmA (M78 family)